ncbi:hypothetical protein N824_01265 [Pedobacter sp. V48]|nr:hypothetical protein N824_01265 [Pedobacter sp. V48]
MKVNTVLIVFVVIALTAPILYLFRYIQMDNDPLEEEMLWI